MSEMDKFVLQYQVELKDAVEKLQQLNEKVATVNKDTKAATGEFTKFGTEAADEIGKLIPGVDKVSGAVRMMSGEFVAAGAAIAVLAAGVKSVMALRDQYGQQRLAGQEIGVSGMRVEEYQRKFVNAKSGNVTRELAADQLKNFAGQLQTAHVDVGGMGREAQTFKRLGVDVGARGQAVTPFNDALTQLATTFSKLKPEEVQGYAKALGMSQDFALALQELGPSVGRVTELTQAELAKRKDSEESLKRFNGDLATLQEKFTELEISLGQRLIPTFTALISLVNRLVNLAPKAIDAARHVGGKNGKGGVDFIKAGERVLDSPIAPALGPVIGAWSLNRKLEKWVEDKFGSKSKTQQVKDAEKSVAPEVKRVSETKAAPRDSGKKTPIKDGMEKWFGNLFGKFEKDKEGRKDDAKADNSRSNQPNAQQNSSVKNEDGKAITEAANNLKKTTTNLDKQMADEDRRNQGAIQSATDMQIAINMFVGAVSTFSNAVDMRQAWAAWAGMIGQANGLQGPSSIGGTTPTSVSPANIEGGDKSKGRVEVPHGPSPYDSFFREAAAKYGLDAEKLKRQGYIESSLNPNAVSEAGAEGIMQLMPAVQKAYGVRNARDPRENIMAGARLMAENLAATNGDYGDALRMYHGGVNRKNWGPRGEKYVRNVLGSANEPVASNNRANNGGESREKMQLVAVQQSIAGRLGVPLEQLQQGMVNRGDVGWASKQLMAGIQNNIFSKKKELMAVGLPEQTRSKIQLELREQESGLAMMRKYSPRVESESKQGDQNITIGERAIVINVAAAVNPMETAEVVRDHLQDHLGDLTNHSNDAIKY